MDRGRSRRAVVVLVIALTAVQPSPVRGHDDDVGPPRLVTTAKLLDVTVLTDFGDGVAPHYAELLLTVDGEHESHGPVPPSVHANRSYRFSAEFPFAWDINSVVYAHEECTPRDRVVVTAKLLELDYDENDAAKAAALSAANLLRLAFTASNPYMIVLSVGSSVVNVAIKGLNGHDVVGTATGEVPANGVVTLNATDGTGTHNADVRFRGVTKELEDPKGCVSGTPPRSRRIKTGRAGNLLYEPLAHAARSARDVTAIASENLTDVEVASIRRALSSLAVGLAETYAGAMITDARAYEGIEEAIGGFTQAQQAARAGEDAAAIAGFRRAWITAAKAQSRGMSAAPLQLPRQVVGSTNFVSTTTDNETALLATVLGSSEPAQLYVDQLPAGVTCTVTRLSETNVFRIDWTLAGVQPGSYPVQLVGVTPGGTVTSVVDLVVDAA